MNSRARERWVCYEPCKETARLDAAIAANLREVGYGG